MNLPDRHLELIPTGATGTLRMNLAAASRSVRGASELAGG